MRTLSLARRFLRSQARRALATAVVIAVAVLVVGIIQSGFGTALLVGAGVAGLLSGIVTWLALEPNRPYHPDAGREDRGFNYVRGEGGGGGA